MGDFRIEKDSMGEVKVPKERYYGAQTQRAIENFPISNICFNNSFISSLALIKKVAAKINNNLDLLDEKRAKLIEKVAQEIISGQHPHEFPLDIFQTGSGTSTNMNINEVIAGRANELAKEPGKENGFIHPNDHVNLGQSSNDVIPTAIRISAVRESLTKLIPAISKLQKSFENKGKEYAHVVKTGRTHLMDATPITIKQQFSGYARQLELAIERIESSLARMMELPQGGTAVGTGINTHPQFGKLFTAEMAKETKIKFQEATNHFEAQATVDAPAELSGQLKVLALGLIKIANDIRWMNSGPQNGLAEIKVQPLQPGSSIMPGKVNPVIEESVAMVAAQVIGNDSAITIAAQSGNFELNVMQPIVAHNLLQSIELLSNGCNNFAERSIDRIIVNQVQIAENLERNPILATALTPLLGYNLTAKIIKKATDEKRTIKEIALELSDLSSEKLDEILDISKMS